MGLWFGHNENAEKEGDSWGERKKGGRCNWGLDLGWWRRKRRSAREGDRGRVKRVRDQGREDRQEAARSARPAAIALTRLKLTRGDHLLMSRDSYLELNIATPLEADEPHV